MMNINKNACLSLAGALLLAAAPAVRSEVTFTFDYSDPSAATHWTPEARAALENAGQRVGAYLTSYTANVTIQVTGYHDPLGGLASALPNFDIPSAVPGFSTIGAAGTKILTGGVLDVNGPVADGWIDANIGDWYSYGDTVAPGEWDFTGLMMHELAHALGFFSLILPDGSTYLPNVYAPLEQYMTTKDGVSILVPGAVPGLWYIDKALWDVTSVGGLDNGMYFSGPHAMAANDGNPVPLYSPSDFVHTISLGHPDASADIELMNTHFPPGLSSRQFTDIEIGMMRDIGYKEFGLVPEPGSSLLTLGGLGLILRRRRRSSPSPAGRAV